MLILLRENKISRLYYLYLKCKIDRYKNWSNKKVIKRKLI